MRITSYESNKIFTLFSVSHYHGHKEYSQVLVLLHLFDKANYLYVQNGKAHETKTLISPFEQTNKWQYSRTCVFRTPLQTCPVTLFT